MGCCEKIFQFLLFAFNVIFFFTGIAVIVCGSIVIAREDYSSIVDDDVRGTSIFLIVVGCVVTVVTFLGCCGAMKENKCMLYTYSALLCAIFIMEFAAGIAAFVYRGDISDDVKTQLNSTLWNDYSTDEDIKKQWDNMQQDEKCCGVEDYTTWQASGQTTPQSCCMNGGPCDTSDTKVIYTTGCYNKMYNKMDDNAVLIGGIAIGLCFVELIGIVIAICLAKDSHDD